MVVRSIATKSLREPREKHSLLGLIGGFTLTILICQILYMGTQNFWRLFSIARYLDNTRVADIMYQYRYHPKENPYAIPISDDSASIPGNSLDQQIYRYGPELSQPIINTINICSNNLVEISDVRITASEDYISVICGVVFVFSPVFNLGGFGRAMVGILILPKEYHWIFASTEDVEDFPGYGLEPVEDELQRKSVLEWIDEANGIIAAGAASYEGVLEEEEERADIRSEEVYALLLNALSEYRIAKSLFKLNLGKYDQNRCTHDFNRNSGYQRPIIIMGVFTDNNKNDFISLRQAQRGVNQINNKPPTEDIDFSCYSNFPELKVDVDVKSRENLIQRAF